jgi:hypothetical protein
MIHRILVLHTQRKRLLGGSNLSCLLENTAEHKRLPVRILLFFKKYFQKKLAFLYYLFWFSLV